MICSLSLMTSPVRELFSVVVYIGFFFFDYILVPLVDLVNNKPPLKDKAKRLEVLHAKDWIFVNFNRLITVVFLYHCVMLACCEKYYTTDIQGLVNPKQLLQNLFIFCFAFFPAAIVVYDLAYAVFHRILHIEWLYPLIHKHHHLQHSPFRGNVDAINTHPIEYIIGEYDHLWALFAMSNLCQKFFGYKPHAIFCLLYIVVAGLLSTLNHTRIDLRIPYVYSVWWHDLHHRVPPSNYGQYTMLWDWVFGWYREESTKSCVDTLTAEEEVRMSAAAAGGGGRKTATVSARTSAAAAMITSPRGSAKISIGEEEATPRARRTASASKKKTPSKSPAKRGSSASKRR